MLRNFVVKINEIILEDELFNEANEHLYSESISKSKS